MDADDGVEIDSQFMGNLQVNCERCGISLEMKVTKKELKFGNTVQKMTLMAIDCEKCGFKDTEVKMGREFMDYGKVITLLVSDANQLKRKIFKSNTAGFKFAEVGFDMADGSMGALYLTV